MSERQHHSSGTEWEARIGYARAIRVGDTIHVSGTLGVGPDGRPLTAPTRSRWRRSSGSPARSRRSAPRSPTSSARACSWWTSSTTSSTWAAHTASSSDVRPASTMLGVAGSVSPEFLVEIEAEAITSTTDPGARPGC